MGILDGLKKAMRKEIPTTEEIGERIENEEKRLRQTYSEKFQSGKPIVVLCVGQNIWDIHKDVILEVATEYGYDLLDKEYDDILPTVDLTFKKGKVEQKKWTWGY